MRNVFVKGLPKPFGEDDIIKLAVVLGTTVTSCMVWKDKKGKSRGIGLVEVQTEEQADLFRQGLRQRTIRKAEQGDEGIIFGEGENAWCLYDVEEDDRTALIVEAAYREANNVNEDGEKRRKPKEKEDPQEKQRRLEVLRKERRQAKREELETGVDPEERDTLMTLEKIRRMQTKFGEGDQLRCWRCWLLHPQCICNPSTPPNILNNFRHRTIVWLHPKEFGRLSNTGGLITVAFPPPQSHILVAGLKEDEDKFMLEIERDPEATFVLFPSDDALTAQEFMDSLRDHGAAGEGAAEMVSGRAEPAPDAVTRARPSDAATAGIGMAAGQRVYTIILVDGTWQQARRLALKIPPHIKRVKLMPREAIDSKYKSPMRSQATPDRVCSLSAYVLLLKELNTPPQVCDYLFELLHKKSEIVLHNSGKEWKKTDGAHTTPKKKPPRNRRKDSNVLSKGGSQTDLQRQGNEDVAEAEEHLEHFDEMALSAGESPMRIHA